MPPRWYREAAPNDNEPRDECIDCDGSGIYPSGAECKSCGGSGRVLPGEGGPRTIKLVPACPFCGAVVGLRYVHKGWGPVAAEVTCEGCFTGVDGGPGFDDLDPVDPVPVAIDEIDMRRLDMPRDPEGKP